MIEENSMATKGIFNGLKKDKSIKIIQAREDTPIRERSPGKARLSFGRTLRNGILVSLAG
jgi:hypothetical protein